MHSYVLRLYFEKVEVIRIQNEYMKLLEDSKVEEDVWFARIRTAIVHCLNRLRRHFL